MYKPVADIVSSNLYGIVSVTFQSETNYKGGQIMKVKTNVKAGHTNENTNTNTNNNTNTATSSSTIGITITL